MKSSDAWRLGARWHHAPVRVIWTQHGLNTNRLFDVFPGCGCCTACTFRKCGLNRTVFLSTSASGPFCEPREKQWARKVNLFWSDAFGQGWGLDTVGEGRGGGGLPRRRMQKRGSERVNSGAASIWGSPSWILSSSYPPDPGYSR